MINTQPLRDALSKESHAYQTALLKTVDGLVQVLLLILPDYSGKEKWNMYAMTQTYITKKNLIQLLKESGQRAYEHVHFLGGPVPKSLELISKKGTISKTPIPYGTRGWWGRVLMIPGDTVIGYHVHVKGYHIYNEIKDTLYHIMIQGKTFTIEPYLIQLTMLYCCGVITYYGLAKWGDSIQMSQLLSEAKNTHSSDEPDQ